MQYAIIEIQKKLLLIDASEMQSLDTFKDAIVELAKPKEDELPYYVCYGSYMPQKDIDDVNALNDFKMARDHWIATVNEDKCHIIAFHDAEPFEMERRGFARHIPFAALIQAQTPIIDRIGRKNSTQAVTSFLRYDGMTPATNVLNRRGIIALKGIENRVKNEVINPLDWKKHVDKDRAKRAARSIK